MFTHPASRFIPFAVLAILGSLLAVWLVPHEQEAVREHLIGFPEDDAASHNLRPIALGILCFLPALAALVYALSGTLDRYLARQTLSAVGITFLALIIIWVLLDLNDNLGEMQNAKNTWSFIVKYYGILFGMVFVLLAPFALLLGLLYSLGKLSASHEVIAMLQTGRGVARVIAPLTTIGIFLSIACLLFNYHLGPWGYGYKKGMIEELREGSASRARNVLYQNEETGRTWLVGRFPYDYNKGVPLRDIQITNKNPEGEIISRFKAPVAKWDIITRAWTFENPELMTLPRGEPTDDIRTLMPIFHPQPPTLVFEDWPETPWQIVNPSLQARYLGIPGLHSWLKESEDLSWVDRQPFITQWHYRTSQPWICLVVVLLAAPLGIVFSRRGVAGGVAVAVFLAAMMLFSAEVFLSLGDSGYIRPIFAAWGTNVVFTAIALLLLWRRLRGRSIYQSLKTLLPMGE